MIENIKINDLQKTEKVSFEELKKPINTRLNIEDWRQDSALGWAKIGGQVIRQSVGVAIIPQVYPRVSIGLVQGLLSRQITSKV